MYREPPTFHQYLHKPCAIVLHITCHTCILTLDNCLLNLPQFECTRICVYMGEKPVHTYLYMYCEHNVGLFTWLIGSDHVRDAYEHSAAPYTTVFLVVWEMNHFVAIFTRLLLPHYHETCGSEAKFFKLNPTQDKYLLYLTDKLTIYKYHYHEWLSETYSFVWLFLQYCAIKQYMIF